MSIFRNSGGALVAALVLAAGVVLAGDATAQTATDLKCKGCVSTKDLGKKAVNASRLKENAVTSKAIKDNSIQAADLAPAAKPSGGDSAETGNDTFLTGGNDVLLTVVVSAPGTGAIHATGSVNIDFNNAAGEVLCEVTTTAAIGTNFHDLSTPDGDEYHSFSMTRAFPVVAAGDATINFVCAEQSGNVAARNPSLTALFVPGAY